MPAYRLGLDLGATSLGWAVYDITHGTLLDCGVRIFDDGREDKTKAALCVKRRQARSSRRRQSRKLIQKQALIHILLAYGLLPEDPGEQQKMKTWNPYHLRAKALDEQISLYEFGRICLQLVQRKGFLSHRKSDKEEGGKLKAGYEQLKTEMAATQARTYGEFLHQKLLKSEPVRLKNTFDPATGKFKGGAFPFRQTYRDEFQQIFDKQKTFYPDVFTEECYEKLTQNLFFQRPLKEAEEGFCTFEPGERRLPKAHPLFQEFRMWQHVLNLTFCAQNSLEYESLSLEQMRRLFDILQHPASFIATKKPILTYAAVKSLLNLDKKGVFNYERMTKATANDQKGILADSTEYALMRTQHMSRFWTRMTPEQKGEIIHILTRPEKYIDFPKTKISTEEYDGFIIDYLGHRFQLPTEAARDLLYEADLEEGFAALSEKAVTRILSYMKQGQPYDVACQSAGYHHSHKEHKKLDRLPYYGQLLEQSCLGQKENPKNDEERFGRINNATVHVALNQVRHVVNELIDRYGKPSDISIEYARDLNASAEQRKKISEKIDENEAENARIIKELDSKIAAHGWTKRDIEKYKIWKNMGTPKGESALNCRECPFSGEKISVSDLMNGEKFQIEHLIPFSRSLDNSLHNKVIASVDANRYKGNRTPYEAFHESKDGYDWSEIQSRVKKLSPEQQWRFGKEAMKKFEAQEGPIARSLNDTRYMTRLLQDYLLPIVHEDGKKTVQSVAGRLTAMVRHSWGLNFYKEDKDAPDYRAFHNHHAVDAVVIAAIDRSQISAAAQNLKHVRPTALAQFKEELYKLKSPDVSSKEKKELHKRIKNFVSKREAAIIQEHVPLPAGFQAPDILRRVDNIFVSHKPKLKNLNDPTSTIGQLHEDSAYGLQKFSNDVSLKANFQCQDKSITQNITDYIPIFYNSIDKKAYYDAFKAWFIVERKAKISNETMVKKQLETAEKEAVQALRAAAQKAFKWFVGGGNFCAEIYQINPLNKIGGVVTKNAGKWAGEIVSNYNATVRTARGEDYFYWRNRYPNARRVMTLKRHDMITGTFTLEQATQPDFPKGIQAYVREHFKKHPELSEATLLFRVKKISGNGQISLTPHNIAKEENDTKSWIATAASLQKYRAQKVFVTPTGKIRHAK